MVDDHAFAEFATRKSVNLFDVLMIGVVALVIDM